MQVNDANRNRKVIAIVACVCALLQLAIVPNIGIANGRANLALVATACLALQIGGRTTVIFGFLAGLFFDLTTTGPVGLMAFELTLVGYLLGGEQHNRLAEDHTVSFQMFLIAAVATEFVYGLAMMLVGQASNFFLILGLRTLPAIALDIVAYFLVAWLARHLSGPTGQPSFGGGSKPSLGTGRSHAGWPFRANRKGL